MNGLEQYRDLYPAHVQVQRCGPPHTSQFEEWLKQPLPLPLPADLILTSTGPLQCCAWLRVCQICRAVVGVVCSEGLEAVSSLW